MAEIQPGLSKTDRYFIDCDDSGHRYLVPADKRVEWNAWQDLLSNPPEDFDWEPPTFAVRLGMSPNHLEFSLPRFSDESPALGVTGEGGPFDKAAIEARGGALDPKRLASGQIWWAAGSMYHQDGRMWVIKHVPNVGLDFETWQS